MTLTNDARISFGRVERGVLKGYVLKFKYIPTNFPFKDFRFINWQRVYAVSRFLNRVLARKIECDCNG